MRLLILGGTRFVGRHIAEWALECGHDLTLFHRGVSNPHLFESSDHIVGDRETEIEKLNGKWDVAIDTSGYVPRAVRLSAEALVETVGCYVFVSSISVYPDPAAPVEEDAEVIALEDPTSEDTDDPRSYGGLKVLCERVVSDIFKERALIVRPGLIVGPHDYTHRFTYWPHRIDQGGEVLAPGDPRRRVQFIDARDLGRWIVDAATEGVRGVFNATGPESALTMAEVLEACRRVTSSDPKLTWIPDRWLLERGVEEWSGLPLWLAGEDSTVHMETNCRRAYTQGLLCRPLEETIADTLEWVRVAKVDPGAPFIPQDEERRLLGEWRSRH